MDLNTGLINAYRSPVVRRTGQHSSHIDVPLGPLFGATVMTERAWAWISDTDRGVVLQAAARTQDLLLTAVPVRRERRHSSAGANPARQLSLQPVAVGADDGGNDIGFMPSRGLSACGESRGSGLAPA